MPYKFRQTWCLERSFASDPIHKFRQQMFSYNNRLLNTFWKSHEVNAKMVINHCDRSKEFWLNFWKILFSLKDFIRSHCPNGLIKRKKYTNLIVSLFNETVHFLLSWLIKGVTAWPYIRVLKKNSSCDKKVFQKYSNLSLSRNEILDFLRFKISFWYDNLWRY